MRHQFDDLLGTLTERQQKILLGVLVERLLANETEEIEFDDVDGRTVAVFVPPDLHRKLEYAQWIAELDHPDGLPDEEYILEKSGIKKRDPSPVE
jgi:hypothetical protein